MTAYFVGTVLYVKTMIRERGSVGYYRASVGYHLAIAAVAAWLSPVLAVLFVLLVVRDVVLPRRSITPKQVGVGEIAASVLLLVVTVTM